MADSEPITALLDRLQSGDREALHDLLPLVYSQLRAIAKGRRNRDSRHTPTLDTTALVHEAYLRLAGDGGGAYENRGHFFAVAATAMRQIVIDEARKRSAQKRGAGARPSSLDESAVAVDDQAEFLLALDQALDRLEALHPRLRSIVELRYFAGLTEAEAAEALDVDPRTARRDWAKAKGWLTLRLGLEANTGS